MALSTFAKLLIYLAPRAGFEPATNRLTAGCSTTELPGNGAHRWCGRYNKRAAALQSHNCDPRSTLPAGTICCAQIAAHKKLMPRDQPRHRSLAGLVGRRAP